MNNKKIGILTWHLYENFGSHLQAYALNKTIEDSKLINYRVDNSKGDNYIFMLFRYYISFVLGGFCKKYSYRYLHFRKKYFRETKSIYSTKELSNIAIKFDTIVAGSDQIWAPNLFNPIFMLNFVNSDNIKKVSYGTSIGLDYIPDNLVHDYIKYLSDFAFISVRERMGKNLLERCCNLRNVSVVLDPCFLLDKSEYIKLEKKVSIRKSFVFCYFLNKNHNYMNFVKEYAQQNGLEIIGWSSKKEDCEWLGNYQWIGPQDFLWLIHNSEVVFTDSYHGTVFSLLYHKKFYTFKRFKDDDPINQNSRLFQLNEWFGISIGNDINNDLLIFNGSEFDFDIFEEKLKNARMISLNYLKEAIK